MVNDVFLIALVTKVFLNTSKVDDGRGGVEFRCVVNGEDVEGRSGTSGVSAVSDAVGQLNGAVVIGIGREGITIGGVTIDDAVAAKAPVWVGFENFERVLFSESMWEAFSIIYSFSVNPF